MEPPPHTHPATTCSSTGGAAENIRLSRAAVTVALATLLSRLLGFVRDAMIAWCFGTGFGADAFLAAFRIPNLFRRLFGEGTLSSAFVPVLTETLWKSGHAEARSLAAATARVLAGLLIVLCLAGMAASPWIVRLMTPGFAGPKLELTVDYGKLTILAQPLFWLLQQVHRFVGNWGWSIIFLTMLMSWTESMSKTPLLRG